MHRGVWDLAPTVAALLAGTTPPVPVPRHQSPRYDRVNCVYAFDQYGRRALRVLNKDSPLNDRNELLELPDFRVLARCRKPPCATPPTAAALSDRFIVWLNNRSPPHKEALVHDLASSAYQATLRHTQGISSVVFSPDGRLLATAAGVTVRLWDPQSGECVRRFKGQRGNVQAIAFHPSGRFLAVACLDETIRFWETASGAELGRYAWGAGVAFQIAFSADGLTAAAATPRAVVVWDVDV